MSASQSSVFKICTLLIRLGALTHDLGKMNKAFQNKLWDAVGHNGKRFKSNKGEFARHELVSYFMLRAFSHGKVGVNSLENLKELAHTDGSSLERRLRGSGLLAQDATSEEFKGCMTKLILEDMKKLQEALGRDNIDNPDEWRYLNEDIVVRLIAYLSLTHHKLPGVKNFKGEDYSYVASHCASVYFNDSEVDTYADCLTFEGDNFLANESKPTSLGLAYLEALASLQDILKNDPVSFTPSSLVRLCLKYARPRMVLADYLGSALKSNPELGSVPKKAKGKHRPLLANTHVSDTLIGMGDTLFHHVTNVHNHAVRQAALSYELMFNDAEAFPPVSDSACAAIDAKRSSKGRFAWQQKAFDSLAAMKAANPDVPTFCVVTAETGSGKTIASAQIARALGSRRFTYCLGLRSLTLQTGKSYQDDLGLTAQDLATIIGDPVSQKAFNAENGAENLAQDLHIVATDSEDGSWVKHVEDANSVIKLSDAFPSRVLSLVGTPVVVCTIDQLIGVTRLKTVKKALLFLRLQNADLVLDEVDNYSPSELKHLQQLCYLAGLSRKNIICLSASMGYLHTEALFTSYRMGLNDSATLTGQSMEVCVANISNLVDPAYYILKPTETAQVVLEKVNKFNERCIKRQRRERMRVPYKVLDCTALEFDKIFKDISALHQNNYGTIPVAKGDRRKVSAGFVRFNTVGAARTFAHYLFQRPSSRMPEDTEIAVVCYHSKYSSLELSVIDRTLNMLTSRKKLTRFDFSTQAIEELIKPLAKATPEKNLIFIVVTTSIMETGRDHDYDWAIVEPNSHRSLIQAAGRVLRHRGPTYLRRRRVANLSIIQHPQKSLSEGVPSAQNPANVWQMPGPLTYLNQTLSPRELKNTDECHARLLSTAARVFNNKNLFLPDTTTAGTAKGLIQNSYPKGIRSALALTQPKVLKNGAALLEQYVLHIHSLFDAKSQAKTWKFERVSGGSILHYDLMLTDWAYRASFRTDMKENEVRVYLLPMQETNTNRLIDVLSLTPLAEDGKKAAVLTEAMNVRRPHRIMVGLTLRVECDSSDEIMRTVLQQEVQRFVSKGFSAQDMAHLASYTLEEDTGSNCPSYHACLGYNRKEINYDYVSG